jgi:hypothetical protein
MRIPHYFALGNPGVLATGSAPASYPVESPSALRRVREIDRRPVGDDEPGSGQQLSLPWQLIIYVIFMLAVIASRFIDFYTNGIPGNPIVLDWKYLLFAAIISIAAFPVVYDKALATKNAPYLVQIALVFTTGLGWEKVLSTVAFFAKR